jgi:hypothetical protein
MTRDEKGIPHEKLADLAGAQWSNFAFGRVGLFYKVSW